jgi:DtxR family Mn-dependent transcriptional regulator
MLRLYVPLSMILTSRMALVAVAGGIAGVAVVLSVKVAAGRLRLRREFRLRVQLEDALKHLYGAAERGRSSSVESLAGLLGAPVRRAGAVARLLHERGLATTTDGLVLTPAGSRAAQQVVRAHRLWERYLADELSTPAAKLHRQADLREHLMRSDEVEHLAASMGHPRHDPHGDPIPGVETPIDAVPGTPVTLMPAGSDCEIVHLEDEPEDVFIQLVGSGLEVGQRITVGDRAPGALGRLCLDVEGRRVELSPLEAVNVFVVPANDARRTSPMNLDDLASGERAVVRELKVAGLGRRRLFDLGFTPGAIVECAFASAFGEPRAYRVRGTVIALRPEQARRIEVEPVPASRP